MNFTTVDPNRIKLEARTYNPFEPKPPKRSFFGGIMKALGAIAGPVGFAMTPFFPPAAIMGAAGYGLHGLGTHLQNKAAAQNAANPVVANPVYYFPGIQPGGSGASPAMYNNDVMNILTQKQGSMNEMTQAVGGK